MEGRLFAGNGEKATADAMLAGAQAGMRRPAPLADDQAEARDGLEDDAGSPARESDLAERAIEGEAEAFAELYRLHLSAVYRFVLFCVGDAEEAADITQDSFLRAYRAVGELREASRFRSWAIRIAQRQVLNYRRQRSRRPATVPISDDLALPASPEAEPQRAAEQSLELARVLAAAAQLTALQRQVLALRFAAGLSVSECAQVLARSEVAIRNLQFHALAALRRLTALEDPP